MTSAYPPPPPYYKLYQEGWPAPAPPPPIVGSYTMFGQSYTTEDNLPSLEEQGVRQIYPKDSQLDIKAELRRLNRELALMFLELVDSLVERPSQYARRVEDIGILFKNIHHLLNSLRPHQAVATVLHILEVQLAQRKQALEEVRRCRVETRRVLQEAFQELQSEVSSGMELDTDPQSIVDCPDGGEATNSEGAQVLESANHGNTSIDGVA